MYMYITGTCNAKHAPLRRASGRSPNQAVAMMTAIFVTSGKLTVLGNKPIVYFILLLLLIMIMIIIIV